MLIVLPLWEEMPARRGQLKHRNVLNFVHHPLVMIILIVIAACPQRVNEIMVSLALIAW